MNEIWSGYIRSIAFSLKSFFSSSVFDILYWNKTFSLTMNEVVSATLFGIGFVRGMQYLYKLATCHQLQLFIKMTCAYLSSKKGPLHSYLCSNMVPVHEKAHYDCVVVDSFFWLVVQLLLVLMVSVPQNNKVLQ